MEIIREEDKYRHVVKEYGRLAAQYDTSCRRFLSSSQAVAIEALNPQNGERILDAGCGTGALIASVVRSVGESGELAGVDLSEDMLNVARRKLSAHNNVALKRGNLESVPYPTNYFDAVVNVNVMHYFHNLGRVLEEFYRLLKPGGRMILVGFCTDYLFFRLVEKVWRIFIPSHIRAYSLNELLEGARAAGFKIAESKCFKIGLFWRSMVLKGEKE